MSKQRDTTCELLIGDQRIPVHVDQPAFRCRDDLSVAPYPCSPGEVKVTFDPPCAHCADPPDLSDMTWSRGEAFHELPETYPCLAAELTPALADYVAACQHGGANPCFVDGNGKLGIVVACDECRAAIQSGRIQSTAELLSMLGNATPEPVVNEVDRFTLDDDEAAR